MIAVAGLMIGGCASSDAAVRAEADRLMAESVERVRRAREAERAALAPLLGIWRYDRTETIRANPQFTPEQRLRVANDIMFELRITADRYESRSHVKTVLDAIRLLGSDEEGFTILRVQRVAGETPQGGPGSQAGWFRLRADGDHLVIDTGVKAVLRRIEPAESMFF